MPIWLSKQYAKTLVARWRVFLSWLVGIWGSTWTFVEMLGYAEPEWVARHIQPFFWWVIGVGAVVAFGVALPRLRITLPRIFDSTIDVHVNVVDMFDVPGRYVVPTNRRFDMSLDGKIERANSVQGEVARRFCSANTDDLQRGVNEALARREESGHRLPDYPLGTTLPVDLGDERFYFVAVDFVTPNNRAEATYDDGVEALTKFWEYVAREGDQEHLVVPLIGTGKGRVKMLSWKHAIERTLRTFFEAARRKTFCKKLTICVLPSDFERAGFDLAAVKRWANAELEYADAAERARVG